MKISKKAVSVVSVILVVVSTGCAQPVTVSPGERGDLDHRWEWAVREAKQYSDGFWIGYGIERLMEEHSFIGSHSDRDTGRQTLEEIISGTTGAAVTSPGDSAETVKQAAERAMQRQQYRDQPEIRVMKKVALLFYFRENPANISQAADLKISNLSLPVNLQNRPLLWLGMAGQKESLSFLGRSYQRTDSETVKKDLIVAVGLHQVSLEVVRFLSGVVQSGASDALRKDAVFWLGQQEDEQVVDLLVGTVRTDRSQEVRKSAVFALSQHRSSKALDALISLAREAGSEAVREQAVFWLGQSDDPRVVKMLTSIAKTDPVPGVRKKAVFALSQQGSEAAVDALIDLARHGKNQEVREQAIFWLGQIASRPVAGELKDMAYQDPETEIQEQAVFAISQLPDQSGIPALIDIARNHPNINVRKKAIFWLGQSKDPRAVDAIVEIIKNQ